MTAADLRGIFSLPDEPVHRPQKKQKKVEPRPEHVSRELHGLWGDRAPPIAITDHLSQSRVRDKPKWGQQRKVQPWDIISFENPARSDGLILKHWKRRKELGTQALAPATPANSNAASEMEIDDSQQKKELEGYHFAKFNVKVPIPTYSDTDYNEHLKSDDWSREETDYLFSLAQDFDLRWILIADRYEYQETGSGANRSTPPMERTMEDLKARYYQVCSKIQLLRTPLASMSSSEFATYEKITKYDAETETIRKKLAQTLISRTPAEVQEEENLLIELKRIATNQERFAQERAELHARLEYPQPQSGTQGYQSSQELFHLMQTLAAADRNRKRRSLLGQVDSAMPGNAAGSTSNSTNHPGEHGRSARASLSGPASAPSSTRPSFPPNHPGLSAREYAKFGVSKHDRLTGGVSFRTDRITKLLVPKPNTQTLKTKDALRELGIATKLGMPTARTLAEFDKLLEGISKLLDVRKMREKVTAEIKIIRAEKRLDQGLEPEAESDGEGNEGSISRGVRGGDDAYNDVNGTRHEQDRNNVEGNTEIELEDKGGVREAREPTIFAENGDDGADVAEAGPANGEVDAEGEQAHDAELTSSLQDAGSPNNREQQDSPQSNGGAAEQEEDGEEENNAESIPEGDAEEGPQHAEPRAPTPLQSSSDEAAASPEPTSRPSTRRSSVRNKRSASVMSAVSKSSTKRARR